jgi:hypothetical protein
MATTAASLDYIPIQHQYLSYVPVLYHLYISTKLK